MTEPRDEVEVTVEVRDLARVLWDFHLIHQEIDRADFVLALGSHDQRVAIYAASLVLLGLAPVLVVSGGKGKVTGDLWDDSEGERYASIAHKMGLHEDRILVEPAAANTGENIVNAKGLLLKSSFAATTGILVMKPYMSRRALATAEMQWPDVGWMVAPPPISFDAYPDDAVPEERMIQLLVGDLQRLWLFAERGFQVPQEIPDRVRKAYERLVQLGFDRYVLPE